MDNMEVTLYLLENGADYSGIIIDRSKYTKNGKKLYIQDLIKELYYPKGSEKYEFKLKIIEFLKAKGVNF